MPSGCCEQGVEQVHRLEGGVAGGDGACAAAAAIASWLRVVRSIVLRVR